MSATNLSLLECEATTGVIDGPKNAGMNRALGQWMTPAWAALELVERYFNDLTSEDLVIEPSCGTGSFLHAIPREVDALGVEIDPKLAAIARAATQRRVIDGDFRMVDLPFTPSAIVGNPPFDKNSVDAFLERAHVLLPDGGRVGFILPAAYFQTAKTVDGLMRRFSIRQDMIPRNIFPGLSMPLCFAMLRKGRVRELVGFVLYGETTALQRLRDRYRAILAGGEVSVWTAVVRAAMEQLGGRADLPSLYREIEGSRPTSNKFWQAQVRKVIQRLADRVGPGVWQLKSDSNTTRSNEPLILQAA